MTINLDTLRKTAEAATPGPWEARQGAVAPGKKVVGPRKPNDVGRGPVVLMQPIFWDERSAANADHIATFDPPTVLALLSRLELAEQAADELLTERDYWEKKLTDLVYALATVEEVGEWSSMNDISDNLIEHIGGKIQKLEKATEGVRELLSYYKVDSPLARVALRALDGEPRADV